MGNRGSPSGFLSVLETKERRNVRMEALNMMDYHMYSVKEVANMEKHAELIDGNLVITDKTSVPHNIAISEISTALKNHIAAHNGNCKVFTENVALYCNELCNNESNFFLPDVMVVCDKNGIKEDGVHVAPRFVAEVTSVSTKKQDYFTKLGVYDKIGVQEYWIVDLQRKLIVRYLSDNEFLPEMYSYPTSAIVPMYSYPGLEIEMSRIFG